MSRYGAHKRRTLDRLTGKHAARVQEALRRATAAQVRAIAQSLNAGRPTFDPSKMDLLMLEAWLGRLISEHQRDVVRVGVSDGIMEVSPERELGLWRAQPPEAPVEDTLSVQLASRRDGLAEKLWAKIVGRRPLDARSLAGSLMEGYLAGIKKAYRILARDWLENGEDSIDEIKAGLQHVLGQSSSAAERTFRTETTNYFNESRREYFADNTAVSHMQLFAITDGRISEICEHRHGWVVGIAEAGQRRYMPAFHPHCRTIQRPLIDSLSSHDALIEKGLALRERTEAEVERKYPRVF